MYDGEHRANRNAFLQRKLGVDPFSAVYPKVYHGGHVEVVSAHNPIWGSVMADSIITDKKGLALTMPFADCPPVFLYDPIGEVIALMHCGWKPIIAGIIQNTILKMNTVFNTDPANIKAFIGPAISAPYYHIKEDVATKFGYAPTKTFLDLQIEVDNRLRKFGVKKENILATTDCTFANDNDAGTDRKYFSWRRDHDDPLRAQIAVIMMKLDVVK